MASVVDPATSRNGAILINGQAAGNITLHGGWNDVDIPVSRAQLSPSGDMRVTIAMPPLHLSQDTRPLVAQVSDVSITRSANSKVWPSPEQLDVLLLGVVLVYIGGILLGLTPAGAATVGGVAAAAWSISLALWHLPVVEGATRLSPVLLAAFAGTLLIRFLCGWIFARYGVRPSKAEWLVLCAAFSFGVIFKAGGLYHPAFLVLDHTARLHQLAAFGNNPGRFIETYLAAPAQMGLGGQLDLGTAIPYSPFFYVVFSPLNWFFHDDAPRLDAMNMIMALIEASSVFALYFVLKRVWHSGTAGACAAAIFVSIPLTNLLFSDGGYPGILAQWLLTFNLAVLVATYPWRRPTPFIISALILAALLLSHTAIAIFVTLQLLIFLVLVFFFDRARLLRIMGWVGIGGSIAFAGYYAFTLPLVFGQILPAVLTKLRGSGSIGQDPSKLGAPLLSGFWTQIAAHYETWSVLLAGSGYLAKARLVTRTNARTDTADSADTAAHLAGRIALFQRSLGLTLWLGAWFAAFILFSIVDLKINLLQKHMEFAIPLIALLSGLGAGYMWERSRPAKVLICLLIVLLAWASAQVWTARVILRVLQPGSG